MTRPRHGRGSADPYGVAAIAPFAGPIAALVGLAFAAAFTVGLLTGDLPLVGGRGPGNGPGGPATPAPSDVVIVDPRTNVPGSIVYVKAGNVWVQSGTSATQVTSSGRASMPAWSTDGDWIYYIDSIPDEGTFPAQGIRRRYVLTYPNLMRVRPDGTGQEQITTGRFSRSNTTWFFWIRDPSVSPDGTTIAVVSDGPDPQKRNVVVQLFDLETGEFSVPPLPETQPLGHQDPAWHPDGRSLLYVKNGRDGARGAPVIHRYDLDTGKTTALAGPGYLAPAWSRDGRFVAATRQTGFGTDVVILDGRTGAELLRVTDDGRSWGPTWSPLGDAIAFLHIERGIVDLRMVRLEGAAPDWTRGEVLDLTEVSGLDGASTPSWFIPADELPPPTPEPTASPDPASSAAPSPSQ